jgi:excisionase family DNA binding protein
MCAEDGWQRMKTTIPSILSPFPRNRPSEGPQFVGRIHAAAMLDVNPQTLDKLIREGALKAFRIGRRVIVRRDELLKLVEANEI